MFNIISAPRGIVLNKRQSIEGTATLSHSFSASSLGHIHINYHLHLQQIKNKKKRKVSKNQSRVYMIIVHVFNEISSFFFFC